MRRVVFEVSGRRVAALVREGEGPGVIFLHGLCGGAIHFDGAFTNPQLASLALMAIDLPGFGESAEALNSSLDTMAAAVLSVAISAGYERPYLVVHSMASSIAARLLLRSAGVVLLEGNLLPAHLEFSDRILRVGRENFRNEFARMQGTATMIMRFQTRNIEDAALRRYSATWAACAAETVWDVAAAINREVRAFEVIKRFAASDVPLTCVYGAASAYAATIDEIAHRLPRAHFTAVPNAAHFSMLDAPQMTYDAVASALYGASCDAQFSPR